MSASLQTVSHSKPPKGLSHPFSAEKLSKALEGVPMFSEIELTYLPKVGGPLGARTPGDESHKLHGGQAGKLDTYVRLLECRWEESSGWTLTVDAVPSTEKAAIAKSAMEQALPELRAWLASPRAPTWFEGHRHVQIGISELTAELALRETHNDHIVSQREFLI